MSYFDDYTNHIIDTEFYAEQKEEEFQEFMDKLKKKILGIISGEVVSSKRDINRVCKECDELVEKEVDEYKKELNEERLEQSRKERDWLDDLMKVAFGIALANSLMKMNKAVSAPFNKTDTVDSFADTLKDKIKKSYKTPLLTSYIFGSSGSTVSDSVSTTVDRATKSARADIHTAITSIQRNTLALTGPKKLKYQYISMLDERTCEVCGSYSGEVFDSLEEAPSLPMHDRCRCYYIPVEEPIDEPTYEEWLAEQPDSTLYKILGPSRYAVYKSGVSIKKFTSNGHLLTLDELYKSLNKK